MDEYDPYEDMIAANQRAIMDAHHEAIRRIRTACNRGDLPMVGRILDALNTFHPMHGESWRGWPEGS